MEGSVLNNFSEDFLYKIVNSIDDPVFVKNDQHIWVVVNDAFCKHINQKREDVIGKSDYDFSPKAEADVFWKMDDRVFQSGKNSENEELFTDSQGLVHTILTKKSLFVSQEGNKFLVGLIRDITEERNVKQELLNSKNQAIKTSEAKSQFLANMSHEIRTPLNSIIGFTDYLMNTIHDDNVLDVLKMVKNSSDHLLGLVNTVLDLSKIESGNIGLKNTDFCLRQLFQDICEQFKATSHENSVPIYLEIDREVDGNISGDKSKLVQIMNNLINNAYKFTNSGRIDVKVRLLPLQDKSSETISVVVSDTGVGIAEDFMPFIFQEFRQQDEGKDRAFDGSGLGLSIVKKYVDLMGGTINVNSTLGVGTRVDLTFTFKKANIDCDNVKSFDRNSELSLKGYKVLVAEDNKVNQILINKVLKLAQADFCVVSNGKQAVEEAFKNDYDVILMDIHMPVLDGVSATEILKGSGRTQHIPIIALTADVLAEDVQKFLDAGMHYLAKPFTMESLHESIMKVVVNTYQVA